ncbi:MAG: hypothetical protein MUF50_01265 [Planctomycetes bacterium]|jgi:hypothetical protein|nr:hypothetical protein [Planctomycetota bacterium]
MSNEVMINLSKIFHQINSWRQNIRLSWSQVFSFRHSRIYALILAIINLSIWFFCFLLFRRVTGELVVLHYNTDFGIDFIAEPYKIFFLPLLSLILIIFNILCLQLLYKEQHFRLISHLWWGLLLFNHLLFFLYIFSLYLINFR